MPASAWLHRRRLPPDLDNTPRGAARSVAESRDATKLIDDCVARLRDALRESLRD